MASYGVKANNKKKKSPRLKDITKTNKHGTNAIHDAFNSVDRDHDGFIDARELQKAMKILRQNYSDDRVLQMIKRINGNDKVSFDQFSQLVNSAEHSTTSTSASCSAAPASPDPNNDDDTDIRATFRAFDADQDGFIGPQDIRLMMESLTHEGEVITDSDINAMIVEADRDGDGLINYAEFILLMQNRVPTSSEIILNDSNHTDDQLSELREIFALFDKDNDSNISMNEVQQVMSALGQQADLSRLSETFQMVDQDGNGLIDFNEFLKMMQYGSKLPVGGSEITEIRALFQAFDKDSSGYIDAGELEDTMKGLGMPVTSADVKDMLKVAGVSAGGRIYYEDFVKMMSDQISSAQQELDELPCSSRKPMHQQSVISDDLEDREAAKVAFAMFDSDADGVITCRELLNVMQSLGCDVNSTEVKKIIEKIDLDGNGMIEFNEFESWLQKHIGILPNSKITLKKNKNITVDTGTTTSELGQLFKVFDKDSDGAISASDLRGTMKDLGLILSEDDIEAMMKQAGLDSTGNIHLIDFCKIMGPMLGHMPSAQSISQDLNCTAISANLDKKHEDADLRVLFAEFDSNCDSFLTLEQCHRIIVFLGYSTVSESFVRSKFNKLDTKKLGLNYAQLRNLLSDVIDKKSGGFSNFSASLKRRISTSANETKNKNASNSTNKPHTPPISKLPNGPFYENSTHSDVHRITATIEIPVETTPLKQNNLNNDMSSPPDRKPPLPPLDCTSKPQECISNAEHTIFIKTVSSAFMKYGQSQLGYVTSAELVELLRSLHYDLHLPHIRELLILTAANPDGLLNLSELLSHLTVEEPDMTRRKTNLTPEPDAWKAFKAFDRDHNGYISLEELQTTMRELGMTLNKVESQEMLKRADSNKDGRIDYKEFIKMVYDNRLVKQAASLQQKLAATSSSSASPTSPPPTYSSSSSSPSTAATCQLSPRSTPASPLLLPPGGAGGGPNGPSVRKTSTSSLSVQSSSLLTASPLRRKSAQHRTCQEMNALCRIFQKLDHSGVGRISLTEAVGQVIRCGITCNNPPDDGTGTVDFEEFMTMMSSKEF